MFKPRILATILLATLLPAQQKTFTNPVLDSGPDPWVLQDGGWYFYMNTTRGLALWRTHDLTDLRHAEKKQIWTPPEGQPYSKETWAPEIHKWGVSGTSISQQTQALTKRTASGSLKIPTLTPCRATG